MLSYAVPSVADKPPPVPVKARFQEETPGLINGHDLVNGSDMLVTTSSLAADVTVVRPERLRTVPEDARVNGTAKGVVKSSTISTESSASSLSSGVGVGVGDLAATHDKSKLISNGGTKLQSHKRVSFGSSKGSMVETLVYESPVQEEPEPSPTPDPSETDSNAQSDAKVHASRVRVTFFEQERPLVVSSPEPEADADLLDATCVIAMTSPSGHPADHGAPYHRQASTDSGWDNPFRPDGDLSREADEIVELIKGGKPITPTEVNRTTSGQTQSQPPPASPVNGSAAHSKPTGGGAVATPAPATAGAVELKRDTVAPSDASQVEHVVLKKKPKCACCVIQ